MTQIVCLVDYDNVRLEEDRASEDVTFNMSDLLERLTAHASAAFPNGKEMKVRLYGGWMDERGLYTPLASWLLAELPNQRGLRSGIRVLPVLSTALARLPSVNLRGTQRFQTKRKRQKMVDAMMAVDAIHFGRTGNGDIIVASDDEDMLPGVVVASLEIGGGRLLWLRHRERGDGLNDDALLEREVMLAKVR